MAFIVVIKLVLCVSPKYYFERRLGKKSDVFSSFFDGFPSLYYYIHFGCGGLFSYYINKEYEEAIIVSEGI